MLHLIRKARDGFAPFFPLVACTESLEIFGELAEFDQLKFVAVRNLELGLFCFEQPLPFFKLDFTRRRRHVCGAEMLESVQKEKYKDGFSLPTRQRKLF
jgi:hypothetical protein